MKPQGKSLTWLLLALFLLPVLASGVWFGRQVRQQWLDHALIEAIKKNDTPVAIALLDQGADANATDKPVQPQTFTNFLLEFWRRVRGQTPPDDTTLYPSALSLVYSVAIDKDSTHFQENIPLVQALLEHRADLNARDEYGRTVLFCACDSGHPKTVQVLLEHHADPNVKDHRSMTPLMDAEPDCALLLMEHGANVNARTDLGSTPLMYFLDLETCQRLLDRHAQVNAQDIGGMTALHRAVKMDDTSLVRLLLQYGAKVSLKDNTGQTPLDCAINHDQVEIIQLLEVAFKKELAQKDKRK